MGPKGIEKAVTWVAGSANQISSGKGKEGVISRRRNHISRLLRRSGMRERAVQDTGTTIELIHVGTPQETTPPCLFFHW